MSAKVKQFTALILLLVACGYAHSEETRYINDVLVVQLRTGPSFSHRNFKGLTSGSKITLLETSEDGNWARVTTQSGDEGWVPSQYLSTEPAARDILISVKRQLESALQQNASLKQQLAETNQDAKQSTSELSSVSRQNAELEKELEEIKSVSANAIELHKNNQTLLLENQTLKNEVDVLTTENQRLNDARDSNEFMNGAYAVLIGVFITLLVPRLWPKKRNDWA